MKHTVRTAVLTASLSPVDLVDITSPREVLETVLDLAMLVQARTGARVLVQRLEPVEGLAVRFITESREAAPLRSE